MNGKKTKYVIVSVTQDDDTLKIGKQEINYLKECPASNILAV